MNFEKFLHHMMALPAGTILHLTMMQIIQPVLSVNSER
jgi:hypothetical protein